MEMFHDNSIDMALKYFTNNWQKRNGMVVIAGLVRPVFLGTGTTIAFFQADGMALSSLYDIIMQEYYGFLGSGTSESIKALECRTLTAQSYSS